MQAKKFILTISPEHYRTITVHFKSAQQGCQYLLPGLDTVLRETRDSTHPEFRDKAWTLAQEVGGAVKKKWSPPFDLSNTEALAGLIPGVANRRLFDEISWGQQVAFAFQVAAFLPRGFYGRPHQPEQPQEDAGARLEKNTYQAHFTLDEDMVKRLSETYKSPRSFAVLVVSNLANLLSRAQRAADRDNTLMPLLKQAQEGYLPQSPDAYGANLISSLLQLERINEVRGIVLPPEQRASYRLSKLDPLTLFLVEIAASCYSTEPGSKGAPTRFVTPRANTRTLAEYLRFFPTETAGGSFALETFISLMKTVLFQELPGVFTRGEIARLLQVAQKTTPAIGPYAGEGIVRVLTDPNARNHDLAKRVSELPRLSRVCLELLGQNMAHTSLTQDEWIELLGR